MFVDSHCHLNFKGLRDDQAGVIARAQAAGVGAMLGISTRAGEWAEVIALADAYAAVWASVGIHPHEVDADHSIDAKRLIAATVHLKVIAIGETGLDYFYENGDRGRQRKSFIAHIEAARATGLPVIVHTRDAENDTARILSDEMKRGRFTGVIHCFTASAAFAQHALALGFYISLSGILTFKNARDLQQTAASLPADRILVETDSPFLSPVPHRGKVCEPAYVTHTAAFLATLRGTDAETIAQQTSDNFFRLFTRAKHTSRNK